VEGFLAAIEVLDEFGDAPVKRNSALFSARSSVRVTLRPLIEEGVFAEARGERVVAENGFVENGAVGVEGDFRAGLARLSCCLSFEVGLPFSYVCSQTAPSR